MRKLKRYKFFIELGTNPFFVSSHHISVWQMYVQVYTVFQGRCGGRERELFVSIILQGMLRILLGRVVDGQER